MCKLESFRLKVLQERVEARRSNYNFYLRELEMVEGIEFLPEPREFSSNRWLSCILTPSFEAREKIRHILLKENIESRPLWKPLHLQPVFENNKAFTDGTSEDLFNRGLCLPSGSNLTEEDLFRITDIIKNSQS